MQERLLFIDASINPRLASDLRKGGRDAESAKQRGIDKLKDPPLFREVLKLYGVAGCTLVTSDDNMPNEHGMLIAELGLTVATLDGRWQQYMSEQEHYKREVVHRWAHAMAVQDAGSVRRYSTVAHREWRRRRA